MMGQTPLGTQKRSGEVCPESGIWKYVSTSKTQSFNKGIVLPKDQNQAVSWILLQYG